MAGKSVNKVILIGNLGKDPEVRCTPSGTPVAKITLATNDRYKDKEAASGRTAPSGTTSSPGRALAEIAGEYLKKGGEGVHRRPSAAPTPGTTSRPSRKNT